MHGPHTSAVSELRVVLLCAAADHARECDDDDDFGFSDDDDDFNDDDEHRANKKYRVRTTPHSRDGRFLSLSDLRKVGPLVTAGCCVDLVAELLQLEEAHISSAACQFS